MKKKEYKKRLEKEKQQMKLLNDKSLDSNIKTGIIIAVSVIVFVFIMFAFTKIKTGEWNLFVKKNDITYRAEIQSTKILCGSILNRDDSEYFVLAYKMQEDSASLYETILERFNLSTNVIPLYKLDLSNSRNGICVADKVNISNNINDLKLKEPTLIKIKDGKITETYTEYEKIKNLLLNY